MTHRFDLFLALLTRLHPTRGDSFADGQSVRMPRSMMLAILTNDLP
jgi:hypothetical protein